MPAPSGDRARWILDLRRRQAELQDAFVAGNDYDALWGEVEDAHRTFVERFLAMLPPGGRVLDAACGTGKYFPMVLARGRSVLGVDQSAAMLAVARAKFPHVPTEQLDLQDLPYRGEFDGAMCVDAMESVPREDWPVILDGLRRALRPPGALYLTVELAAADRAGTVDEDARRSGLPVHAGEWFEPDGYFHYYPRMEQVRAWVAAAGFAVVEETQGPWHEGGYAYHHVLGRGRDGVVQAPPSAQATGPDSTT